MTESAAVESLLAAFRTLAPWGSASDFSTEEWRRYADAARLVQNAAPGEVKSALVRFLDEADGFLAAENETRLFLLMRVVFDLPSRAPVDQRRAFKGWANWPAPDAEGKVKLSWPLDLRDGRPTLLAHFEGADGPRYAAVEEYYYLLARFPFRQDLNEEWL